MSRVGFNLWRALFVIGGALVIAGGFMHPRGTMAQMLADPNWLPGHSLQTVGFLALCAGLALYRRDAALPRRTRWWATAAAVMMALETLEMAVHTLAYVDRAAAQATVEHVGMATPVLLTHLWMATLVGPVSGVALIALIWVGMRERSLGSPWIGWLGMIGAAAHAAVMPLVFLLNLPMFGIFFPMIIFLALWFCLAGVWPRRKQRAHVPPAAARPAPREAVSGAV
ncbi:MAG TPA: hypothetical protein VEX86_23710 [Longimicrobium sp.]|nr:hypothetical protein [Longimicrobium sp.]